MGGSARYNTRYRDIGCSLLFVLLTGFMVSWHWTLILCFGLMWGALSTYWKRGANSKWYNWGLTGLGYSLAIIPFCIAEGYWVGFISRTIVLTGATIVWSELNNNAVWEESGRGFFIVVTIPLLLV